MKFKECPKCNKKRRLHKIEYNNWYEKRFCSKTFFKIYCRKCKEEYIFYRMRMYNAIEATYPLGWWVYFKIVKNIICPKCDFGENEGIDYISGFIQVRCKKCNKRYQYDYIFKCVVPFGKSICLFSGEFVDKRK